jgi:hypothetical protein
MRHEFSNLNPLPLFIIFQFSHGGVLVGKNEASKFQ